MRRDREEKQRSIWKLVGAFVVAVMFFGSTVGYVFFYSGGKGASTSNQDQQQIHNYKGLDFVLTQNGWQASTALGTITTVSLPSQALGVECECSSLSYQSLQAQKAYVIASSQEERQAAAELLRNIPFGNVQRACLPEDADALECENLPLRSCEDASGQTRILIFKEVDGIQSEGEGISKFVAEQASFNNNCLIVEGENLIKATDRVIYKAFGIG